MKNSVFFTIFFSAILIFSLYTIPSNFSQSVFAHEHPSHEECWDAGGFNQPYNFLDLTESIVVLALTILAYLLFWIPFGIGVGAATTILGSVIPTLNTVFFALKAISFAPGIALAAYNCPPMIVPPPVTVAGKVNLDCNDEEGFTFEQISNNFVDAPDTLSPVSPVVQDTTLNTLGYWEPTIETVSNDSRDLPLVYVWSGIPIFVFLALFFTISIVIDGIFLWADSSGKKGKEGAKKTLTENTKKLKDLLAKAKDFVKKLTKKAGKEAAEETAEEVPKKSLKKVLKEVAQNKDVQKKVAEKGAGAAKSGAEAGVSALLNWKGSADAAIPNDGYTIHPFHKITSAGVQNPSEKTFKLGMNEITYFSTAHLSDTSKFPFNVYDSEPPEIVFSPKNVTVEANAHYGFKVTSKTLPLVKMGSKAVDKCDPKPSFDYIGQDFFLLTKLKTEQYAPWKTTDKAPQGGYNALTSEDIDRVLETEIKSLTQDDYQPKRTAAISPTQTVEFSNLKTEFSTARHLFSIVTNDVINELIANNTKKVVPTADPKLASDLTDQITLDEIGISGMSKLDEETLESTVEEKTPLRLDNISPEARTSLLSLSKEPAFREGPEVEFVDFDLVGQLFDLVIPSATTGRPNIITDTEPAQPNVFVDYQIVTVVDTIAPNILVTEDIAIEVNATDSTVTKHPALHQDGCIGSGDSIACKLEIRPPAIFDIADPFPELHFNIKDDDSEFEKLETPNLVKDFPLGVTFIEWKAIDFSGNGNEPEDMVTQIVNIKKEGTNIVSEVYPIEDTVFATVPKQIKLIANNTDLDPLKFTITQDPEKGVIDTPIDAVFLRKFTIPGEISKLTGITNELNSTTQSPIPGIFFTDFLNKRILHQTSTNDVEALFEISGLGQNARPEGISLTPDGTYMIGNWKEDKILEVNGTGNIIKEFDIQGLFADTDIINKKMITVDQENSDIYVTDSINGTITKLIDFDIFGNNLRGVESNTNSVFVADKSKNIVSQFDTSGKFLNQLPNSFVNATDVTLDSDDYIYVLDIGDNAIQRFDPTLQDQKEFGEVGDGSSFFNSPQGVTSNGTHIFVADTGNHQVKKVASFETPYVESYTNSSQDWVNIGDHQQIPSFDNSTELNFVSIPDSSNTTNHVYRLVENDIPIDYWSAQFNLNVAKITGQNNGPASVFLWLLTNNTDHPQTDNPQDALGITYENQVIKFYKRHNVTTSSTTIIDNISDNSDYIIKLEKLPNDLATVIVSGDPKGNNNGTFVAFNDDIFPEIQSLNVIQHANNKTSTERTPELTITETIINPIITWMGLCSSGPNCDTFTNSSKNFSCTDGSCFGTGQGNQTGQFTSPTGISANSTHLFVTDNHRVQIFNDSGTHIMTLGSSQAGEGLPDFNSPTDVEVNSSGEIIVIDSGNNRTKIYDNSGILQNTINSNGFGSFSSPSGVGVDPSGNIYISDSGNKQIIKLDSGGNFVKSWKSSIDTRFEGYSEIFELYEPEIKASALEINNENVYIGDWRNGQSTIISTNSNGGKIATFDISSIASNPHSITIHQNKIFVTNPSSQEILILNSDGAQEGSLDVNGTDGFTIIPTGITKETDIQFSNGTSNLNFSGDWLYVFDSNQEQIYAVDPNGVKILPAFSAKNLFSNLNDIAVNSTHVFGLNTENDTSKIVKIRWDKGITNTLNSLGNDVTGITIGKNMDSNLIFYTTNDGTTSSLYKLDPNESSEKIIDLDSNSVAASGVSLNPVITQLVNVTITDDPSNNLSGPRGIAFSSDERMYVSSFGTDSINILNSTTFEIIGNITSNDLDGPTDIVISPNGTLFIASSKNHKILEFNQTSNEVETFVEAKDGIVSPSGLTISPDSLHLFVANGFDNTIKKINLFSTSSIQEVRNQTTNELLDTFEFQDPTKARGFISDFITQENVSTLQNPQYLAFDPSNGDNSTLYVSSFNTNEILSWYQNGTFAGVFADDSTTSGLLEGPTGIEISPDGKYIFVSSTKTNQVLQFMNTGEFIGVFSDEQTYAPDGLSFGPNGNLFVSSVGSNEVLEYGDSPVRFYISDWTTDSKHRIVSFDSEGKKVDSIEVPTVLNNPGNIVSDSEGKLWISDSGNQRLVRLNVVAEEVISPTIPTDTIVEFEAPELTETSPGSGIFVDSEGEVFEEFISDVVTSVIPQGLSVDNNDNLYVSDWINHRIVALDNNGNFVGTILLNSTFTQPSDIAINQTTSGKLDDVWVYDKNFGENLGHLVSFDIDKQFEVLEFTEELSPYLRGLTINSTSLVTTPLNSGSLLEIDQSNSAKFNSKHFIIPLGIDIVDTANPNEKKIFVTDWKESRIVQLDKLGIFEQEFDLKRTGFVTPEQGDIEVNHEEEFFWIVEPRRATINQVDFNGTALSFPSVADKYVWISGVDSDNQDNFYVISNQNATLSKYDIRGTLLADAKEEGFVLNSTQTMKDVSLGPIINSSQSVYVALVETNNNKIMKLNANSLEIENIETISVSPSSLAISNNATVYVSDSSLNILKLNSDLSEIGTLTISSAFSGSIEDMVIDSKNNLFAADKVLDRVYKYDLEKNEFVGWLGKCTNSTNNSCDIDSQHSKGFVCTDSTCSNNNDSFGRDVSQFFEPTSLAIDGLNNVYVADVKLARDNTKNPVIELLINADGTCPDGTVKFSETTCREVFNFGNVPRVQKFTQNGFFVDQVVSDTNQTLVKGNFEWVNGLAYGTNNFYVADVEKLHVFDVNPFINLFTNTTTKETTAEVTYQSFVDLVEETDQDSFMYQVFDGFVDSNVALVNITMTSPDPDADGIFGDIDLEPNTISTKFQSKATDKTNGNIVNIGDQVLTIREDRDVEKGLYAQANILGGEEPATVNFCDDLAKVTLKPGNRIIVTCTINGENNNEVSGVEIEVLRGKIDLTLYDREGRSATSQILLENTVHFSPDPFEFVTPENNLDILNQTIHYNGIDYSYLIPKNSKVRIDTASPIFPEDNCGIPITLEADTIFGIKFNSTIPTGQQEKFQTFLDWITFNATDVDNGSNPETDGDSVLVVSNVTSVENRLFPHNGGIIPTRTTVEFFTIDKVGNNATCTNFVNVRDTTPPILEQIPVIMNITGANSEVGNAFFDIPKIMDLPFDFGGPREQIDLEAKCSPISGSEFLIGNTTVICSGYDLSSNLNSTSFTVVIEPNPEGLSIKNIKASGKSAGLNNGDTLLVEFTVPTNQPKVESISDINSLFEIIDGDLGSDVSGKFIDPSNLLLTINDVSTADLVINKTKLDLKFTDDFKLLQSASGVLNSTGFNKINNPITLTGDFSLPIAPYITSFMVNDPFDDGALNDDEYSEGDEFTIRFSEPTNAPGRGDVLTKDKVDELFDFTPYSLGEDYVGVWKNPSTFIITVTEQLLGDVTKEPTLGSTQAQVIGNIKNLKENSIVSNSISPPLSGNFGPFKSIRQANENMTLVQDLPSGIKLAIGFPIINTTTITTINGTELVINHNQTGIFLEESIIDLELSGLIPVSEQIDVSLTNSTEDCALGCEISFYIQSNDLPPGIGLGNLFIIHDKNDDTLITGDEIISPNIERLPKNFFRVYTILTSFSGISLAGQPSGGGGGDETAPVYEGARIGGGGSVVYLDEIKFENHIEKSIVKVGEEYRLRLTIYENSGPDALQHISLYTDLRGFEREIHHSDAYVRYDKGTGISEYDIQNLFSETDIFMLKNGPNLEVEFTIVFNKPMEESDLIIRAWDVNRNSWDTRFVKALEVIPSDLEIPFELDETLVENDAEMNLDTEIFNQWSTFSEDSLSDSELLSKLGLEGNSIPEWYKTIVIPWIQEGLISIEEFVNSIKFFNQRGLLE